MRLVGSHGSCAGRVEIFYQGAWGTVCDDLWDLPDANIVCKQLGCGWAVSAPAEAHFGEGSGKILLDDLHCRGQERHLEECLHPGWLAHNCGHGEDAGAVCSGSPSLPRPGSSRAAPFKGQCQNNGGRFHLSHFQMLSTRWPYHQVGKATSRAAQQSPGEAVGCGCGFWFSRGWGDRAEESPNCPVEGWPGP